MLAEGVLVVFDDVGGSGKTSQIALLKDYLEALISRVQCLAFPQRNNPNKLNGTLVVYLQGKKDLPLESAQLLFAADRYCEKSRIEKSLEGGTIVLVDRYILSGISSGIASGLPRKGYEMLEGGNIKLNMTISMDLHPSIARIRVKPGAKE